jgi:TPR repeat protein
MTGFIGSFAAHRRDWTNKTVDPGTVRLFNLVNSLRAGAEMDVIIKDVKLDPLLSYRILCHANSAAIGSQRKILELKDAILLLGREPLFRWLVVLMCASTPNAIENSALLENALARGRMMELLAREMSIEPSEGFFLTGVLSLLDVILQVPSPALLAALDLPDDVKAALTKRTGPYSALLRLVEASEKNDATGAKDLCTELGIEHRKFCEIQTEAMNWVRGQTPEVKGQGDFADLENVHQIAGIAESIGPIVDVVNPQDGPAADITSDDEFDSVLDSAQRGETVAQCAMGARYATGDRVGQDLSAALGWYLKAAEQGNANAQWNAAAIYAQDHGGTGGVHRDTEQAAHWCRKAATQGFAPAQAMLGAMYAQGNGVPRDIGKAMEMLEKAARQDDVEAQYNLAVLCEEGQDKDLNLAEAWLSQAAEQGLPAAQERLGLMYATGKPMKQNMVEAHKWFLIASTGNLESAKVNLENSFTLMTAEEIVEAKRSANAWLTDHQKA